MPWDGYFEMGGTEILNRERAYSYAKNADCPAGWLKIGGCEGLDDALGDPEYTTDDGSDAPWYDKEDEATHRFYGAYPVKIEGISDSTRTAAITEGIADGGVISGARRAVKQVRATAMLIARGMDALEAGLSWLDAALELQECSTHQGSCGEVDACFFVSCPPPRGDLDDDSYDVVVDSLRRMMHGVVTISGPIVTQTMHRDEFWGYLVEFTVAAGTPFVFSMPKEISTDSALSSVYADIPYNIVLQPSAQLTDGVEVVVATNYADNPSVEVDTTHWSAAASSNVSAAGAVTGSRVTDISAVGAASYRVHVTATPAGTNGTLIARNQSATFPAADELTRMSVSVWTHATVGGTAVLGIKTVTARWRTGTTDLRTDVVGTKGVGVSGVVAAQSIQPPAGANNVIVEVTLTITSWAAGASLDLYADAVAVTVP